jgi:MerR HTH family regulatory protein
MEDFMAFLTTKAVATMLDLTPDCVRWHEKQGHIVAIRIGRGAGSQRLFVQEDIERFQKQRGAKAATRQAVDAAAPGGGETGGPDTQNAPAIC